MTLDEIVNQYAYAPTEELLERVKKSMREDIDEYCSNIQGNTEVKNISSNTSVIGSLPSESQIVSFLSWMGRTYDVKAGELNKTGMDEIAQRYLAERGNGR